MIVGLVEYPQNAELIGWAFSPESSDDRLLIEAFIGDRLIGSTMAALPRADREPETNAHGFQIVLRRPLTTAEIAQLAVWATGMTGERAPLPMASAMRPPLTPRASAVDETRRPVFVLGAARSGTTAVTQALLGLPRYDGVEEGHLLTLCERLVDTIGQHYASLDRERLRDLRPEQMAQLNTLDRHIPAVVVASGVRRMFVELLGSCFRGEDWVIKTPGAEMIEAAARLRAMWPQARFIFMKRRAIENVESRLRKFRQEGFRDHCTAWTAAMWSWTRARPALVGAAIELDQLLLARDPSRAAAAIGEFLALSNIETRLLGQTLANLQPERTTAVFPSICDLDEMPWSDEQMRCFQDTCTAMLEEFGYDSGKRYFREGAEDRALVQL